MIWIERSICGHFYSYIYGILLNKIYHHFYCKLNYHDQEIRRTLTHDIRKHWTAVSTLSGLIISVYHDPKGDRVLCMEYVCNLQDIFRLIGRAIVLIS